jgi:diguanylate cyclase (GGDEF)-like protein
MKRLRRLLFGSLATALLGQTLILSIVPMLLVAVAALYTSTALIQSRFEDEDRYVASTAANGILEKATETTHTADLLADFPTTQALAANHDVEQLTTLLIPMKSRFGVDLMDITDPTGTVVAAAQDSTLGQKLPDALLRRVNADAQRAWVLVDEPRGVMLRAFSPIRGPGDDPVGMVDVGVILGPKFLQSIQVGSHAELALSWNDQVKASTLPLGGTQLPSYDEINAQANHRVSRTLTIGGKRYLSTFATVESHTDTPVTLAVFAPLAPIESVIRALWIVISLLGLILMVGVVVLTWRMAHGIIRPFRELVAAARKIQDGDLSARVEPTAQHEIRVLEDAFNTMMESLGERERERAAHEAELLHMASHDPLTGLPNRALLEHALTSAVADAGNGMPSTLMYLDLDQFKIVNDTLGHGSGDRLLVRLAELLRSVLRDQDLLARLGGDEFAALLPGLQIDDAANVAERVRRVVDEYRFVESGQGFALGLSIGVTAITGSGSASEVLGQADIACYTAKSEGRNRVAIYEPEAATLALLSGDGKWTVELKDALRENRLQLVFQPVMQVADGRIEHYETLIRLRNRDGSITGPAAFIPAAERSGLIRDIDHWVLNAALDRIREENTGGNQIRLAINLSGITLCSPESAEFIRKAIRSKRVDPAALIFEITETALMTNLATARSTMDVLGGIGCHFSLDDFGSGFSSFTYLSQLPVNEVKIDGSFVRDLATNPANQAIVRAIANVTRAMGKQSVAEWVEDAASLDTLRKLHVDLAQGYYIGRPSSDLAPSGNAGTVGSGLPSGRNHEPIAS